MKHNQVECQFCESSIDPDASAGLYEKVDRIERRVREGLLLGIDNSAIMEMLVQYSPDLPGGIETILRTLKFQPEQRQAGQYLLKQEPAGDVDWLLSCPSSDWFQPLPSEV
ncbi:MAG: hypothetical protein R3C59_07860 [Planctomycetaceae bacterium]